jgi:hypothetical protein
MPASNSFQITTAVANIALPMFKNKLSYLMTGNYDIERDWRSKTYQFGDLMNIRRQVRAVVGDGQQATSQPLSERVTPLQISHQYYYYINYSAKDLTLSMPNGRKEFARRYIEPAINSIVSKMENDIVTLADTQLYFTTGTPGSAINSYQAIDAPSQILLGVGVPDDNLYQAISLGDNSLLRAAYTNNFNMSINEDVNKRARIGHLGYFDVFANQANNTRFTSNVPAGKTGTLTSNVANGATSLAITVAGIDGTVIKAGDKITISGVNFVNFLTQADTGYPVTVTVTAPATVAAGAVTVNITPDLTWDTNAGGSPNPNVNITTQPLAGATVTFTGGSWKRAIAYHRDALSIACPAMEPLDTPYSAVARHPDVPISLRISRIGDVDASVNKLRVDVLAGFRWHGELAAHNLS